MGFDKEQKELLCEILNGMVDSLRYVSRELDRVGAPDIELDETISTVQKKVIQLELLVNK